MRLSSKFLVPALLLLSSLMLPNLSFATSRTDFSNGGGTLSGTNAGLSLSGSLLVAVNGFNGGGLITGNLGTVTFTTGALSGGSLQMGGTFAPGGTFTIDGNGTGGLPNGDFILGNILGNGYVDPHHLGQWNSQLHPHRSGHRNDGWNERERGERAVDDQHREGILQRVDHDFRWRHVGGSLGSGALDARVIRYWRICVCRCAAA